MAWNEPGKGQKDPWNRNSGSGGGGKGPDFNVWMQRIKQRLGRMGGGGPGGILTIVAAVVLAWILLSSFTVIHTGQVGVVLRFGQYSRTVPAGFHFKAPSPVETVRKVRTKQIRSVSDRVRMLTNDENIVTVDFNVQYQVSDARKYLFSMSEPDATLNEAAEAAVRSVVGGSDMSTILSGQGAQLVSNTRKRLQKTLQGYGAGIVVTEVSFQNVSPPKQVKEAFDDVNKAREDKQRIENEARAYASQVIPEARGEVARIQAQASGYKAERVARATGDANRFDLLLGAYHKAPDVTRERLWLETMENVLSQNTKVLDGGKGRNVIYLPLKKAPDDSSQGQVKLPGVGPVPGSSGSSGSQPANGSGSNTQGDGA